MIEVQNLQRVHQLALVLVESFHLNVEHRLRIDVDPLILMEESGQLAFFLLLDVQKALQHRRIVREGFERGKFVQIAYPVLTARKFRQECGKFGIADPEPSPVSDAVRLVAESFRKHLMPILLVEKITV